MRTWLLLVLSLWLIGCDAELHAESDEGVDGALDASVDLSSPDAETSADSDVEDQSLADISSPDMQQDTMVDDASTPDAQLVNPNALFVSLDGDDNNDGRSETAALRTISAATAIVGPGQTIYVKAGNYGREEVTFPQNGTMAEPIELVGYQTQPGDNPTIADFDHTSSLDASIMPLLDGGDRDAEGDGINLGGRQYIRVLNFQITNYRSALYAYRGKHLHIENVIAKTFGVNDESNYSGKGIIMGSEAEFNIVKNSVVVNAGAEGIMLYGDDNTIDGCRVYGSDDGGTNENVPDYYMMIKGDRNIIQNSLVKRVGDLPHGGHGIGIKGEGTENTIRNNVADGFAGTPFYARHRGVVGNFFLDNTARNGGLGMSFRDGASGNVVERFTAEDTNAGVMFFDTSEDEGKQFSGNDNVVRDSTFTNCRTAAIWLHDYTYNDVYARRNVIENVVIDGAPALFAVRSFGEANILRDSTINNVVNRVVSKAPRVDGDLGFTLSGNSGTGNGFDL